MQALQLGAWLDAELLDEDSACVLIGLQRLGLTAARYSAVMSCPRRRSRNGNSATSPRRSPTKSLWPSSASSASIRSSRAARRRSSSFCTAVWTDGVSATLARTGPRHNLSAARSSPAAWSGAASRIAAFAWANSSSKRWRSNAPGVTWSR
jgi:hypothetical protein